MKLLSGILFTALSVSAFAEMQRIGDEDLSEVTGQSGVYLSGEVKINENGGPLSDGYFGACTDNTKVCGARWSFQTEAFYDDPEDKDDRGGWFVIDNIQGTIAFEGLTLQVREITSGFGGDWDLFNGSDPKSVIEIGLPGTLRMKDFQYTLATSSTARPTDPGFQQLDFMTVEMSGDVTLEGNLLVFPTP